MSYVFRLNDAERHEQWFRSDIGRMVLAMQRNLLRKVWAPVSPQRVLEVGCGSGIFLEWLAADGHLVTGLDPSGPALELARGKLGDKVSLDWGFAEDLPYSDNEFDTVALITSLEFVEDPAKALREACRVARRHVLLGTLNRYSVGPIHFFLERLWKEPVYRNARFFSVFQLRRMAWTALSGKIPIKWRTCMTFPLPVLRYLQLLERCPLMHRQPFGQFIAMRIDMRFRIQAIQTPIFSEIPGGVANASMRSMLYRSSRGDSSSIKPVEIS
ncbi:MAG: methyltransferase domain-containing protein [Syntrophobacteraceae bacterium]